MYKHISVYVASPYRFPEGHQYENAIKSIEAASIIASYGFIPYAPLWNHFTEEWWKESDQYWLDYDLYWLLKCDVVLRLPGYSTGADNEVICALAHNIPIFYSIEELVQHYA